MKYEHLQNLHSCIDILENLPIAIIPSIEIMAMGEFAKMLSYTFNMRSDLLPIVPN